MHFVIRSSAGRSPAVLVPQSGARVFRNQQALAAEAELGSGDEIRVGHWTFRYQRVYERAQRTRQSDLLSSLAKALVAVIVLLELGIVLWFPRWMKSATVWEEAVARQRAVRLLDRLRHRTRKMQSATDLDQAAKAALTDELDSLARYVRDAEDRLSRSQWRLLFQDLTRYDTTLQRFEQGAAFKPMPLVDVDGSVRALIGIADETGPTP